jgi:hypothetical protein
MGLRRGYRDLGTLVQCLVEINAGGAKIMAWHGILPFVGL